MRKVIRRILHFLWINRDQLYIDFKKYAKAVKQGGVVIEDEDFIAGDLYMPERELVYNRNKNLVQYEQSSWTCVPYSYLRSIMYNTNLFFTKDEIESFVKFLEREKLWKNKKGMRFSDVIV